MHRQQLLGVEVLLLHCSILSTSYRSAKARENCVYPRRSVHEGGSSNTKKRVGQRRGERKTEVARGMFADPSHRIFSKQQSEENACRQDVAPSNTSFTEVFRCSTPANDPFARFAASSVTEVISISRRDGEEVAFPVVHPRAGGSISPPVGYLDGLARSDVATRAQRHTSVVSSSMSSQHVALDASNDVSVDELAETYRQSRQTPTLIRQHSRPSTHSTNIRMGMRADPVEESPCLQSIGSTSVTSLASTPRLSLPRTPVLSNNDLLWSSSQNGSSQYRRSIGDGAVPVTLADVGVSSSEMAEYFADGVAAEVPVAFPHRGSVPLMHLPPLESSAIGDPLIHGLVDSSTAAKLNDHMELQSSIVQGMQQRLVALEEANRVLLNRVAHLESLLTTDSEGHPRVVATSGSPSLSRFSESVDSARPSTRAPSKAVQEN